MLRFARARFARSRFSFAKREYPTYGFENPFILLTFIIIMQHFSENNISPHWLFSHYDDVIDLMTSYSKNFDLLFIILSLLKIFI